MSEWVPLMDYAVRKGVSLSTLRRYIKANKIKYKIEYGRYLLFDGEVARSQGTSEQSPNPEHRRDGDATAYNEYDRLRNDFQKAQEEIAELKTLIALYEEGMSRQPGPRQIV